MVAPQFTRLRAWARELKAQLITLWFCGRDPRTPWYAKALAAAVVAYAFSPIDLIPDFIPVLGYLDDLIIVPLGIWLALRLIPASVIAEARQRADQWMLERQAKPHSYAAAAVIVALWLLIAYGLFAAFGCSTASAAPNEIKVFTDELARYREHTLETHVNRADKGPLRVMPEYSYGLWRDWEFSLQLPFAFTSNSANGEGYRAELQYIAPHDEEQGFYWGINMEIARHSGVEDFWGVEVIPIIGWRGGRWHLVANPGFERPVSGTERSATATPAAKVAYRAWRKNDFGLEYYRDDKDSHALYLAWDGKVGKSDINVGLGRGAGSAADRWVLKAIYEFAF